MTDPGALPSRRERALRVLSDACADIGTWFYDLCAKLDPGPFGEPCPDCGVPTTVPKDQECPECRERWEAQKRDEAIYNSGRHDGFTEGAREMEERLNGPY